MGTEVTLSSQAYQMELELDCLIGTSTPAMGYSRSRGGSCYEADMVPGGT